MSALWKQCQQGSSNEGWAKYIQAAALALGFPSETRFTTPLADAPQHDMRCKKQFGLGFGKNGGDDETRTCDLCRDSAPSFGNSLKLRDTDGYQNRALEPQVTIIGP
jgi:hypothetical protein